MPQRRIQEYPAVTPGGLMKRIFIAAIAFLMLITSVYAYTDSFSTMNSDPLFLSLLDVIKNGGDAEAAEAAYDAYISQDISAVDRSRAEYHMVRYYMDKDNEDAAWEHFGLEKEAFNAIPESEGELQRRTAEADMVAAEYYITGKMGTGMDSSKLMKELYKDFPDEYYTTIQEAFRLLYTPPIAGGSYRKALRLINDVEKNQEGISKLEYYSMLVAKAMALSESDEFDESDDYLDEAESIYSFDNAIEDVRRDNRRGRR